MKNKLIGIFIMMLMIATAFPVSGLSELTEDPLNDGNITNEACVKSKSEITQNGNGETVFILVNENLFEDLENHLNVYKMDLNNEGFDVKVHLISSASTYEDIRSLLIDGFTNEGLVGCVFVGDIPYFEYETYADEDYDYEHAIFACDLYYMDLNGHWSDDDGNGFCDTHSGNTKPEIWIGRLWTPQSGGNDVHMLKNYFRKNHAYRTGWLSLPKRALFYRDFSYVYWVNYVKILYDDVTVVDKSSGYPSPSDYLTKLQEDFEFVFLSCHSNYQRHSFEKGKVYYSDILEADPHAFFYLFSSCMVADYTLSKYIVGAYVFSESYGLAAMGSTKTTNRFISEELFNPLNEGYCIGDAWKNMFQNYFMDCPYRYYGATIIGDPSIIITDTYGPPPDNNPPEKPEILGKINGSIDTSYIYYITTNDMDLDRIRYVIDWGDGSSYYESQQIQSGDTLFKSHSWDERDTYAIRVKAIDERDAESDWATLEVSMPKNKAYPNTPFLRFLEQYPHLFPLLRQLLGL